MIAEGMHDIPAGHVPAAVTYLQMFAPAMDAAKPFPAEVTATQDVLDTATYRELFRDIGGPWLWSSRLTLSDDDLAVTLGREDIELWVIRKNGEAVGIVELDFQGGGDCELAYFGMVKVATGQGLGGPMMALAQTRAFSRGIERLYVHTCNWDDPRALAFYQKAGFVPYKMAVEVMADPRLSGIYPASTAPHVPYLS